MLLNLGNIKAKVLTVFLGSSLKDDFVEKIKNKYNSKKTNKNEKQKKYKEEGWTLKSP